MRTLLKAHDSVAIIAPAAATDNPSQDFAYLEQAVTILESWGLDVCEFPMTQNPHFYLASEDKSRAVELVQALNNPKIKAIFVTRGGYGCARLLPYIESLQERQDMPKKILCGFSDVTALMSGFIKVLPQIESIHGPVMMSERFVGESDDAKINRLRLKTLLFEDQASYEQQVQTITSGYADAPMMGGCLSILVSLLATPFEPDFAGKIIFVEDVSEKPYNIDRLLTQLKQAGKFDNIKGLVFGEMINCVDHKNDLQQVIADVLCDYTFPVVYGFKAGHGTRNIAFRQGSRTIIDTQLGTLCIH